ncbi:DUF2690 domain-containing protein [Corallococcus llansteffanensis]|uniref:DUF2690 domain-containing protein n=1 Tax=Corallococcus llansteffanensis TaxID=2316731 RepID=A0A3A8PWE7_9BACT|nr:DUF2690 domain-containing protein [Corallococcus llansteffanensis]RKH58045.1 DUF2690 domain-containing protein [Corallococcus llansteffanensis]
MTRQLLAVLGFIVCTTLACGPVGEEAPQETAALEEQEAGLCPTCYNCNNQDPSFNSCSTSNVSTVFQATPIKHGVELWGYVELRYSATCGMNWARVHSYISGQYSMKAWVEQGGTKRAESTYTGSTLDGWSKMYFGCDINTKACACITRTDWATECSCTPEG